MLLPNSSTSRTSIAAVGFNFPFSILESCPQPEIYEAPEERGVKYAYKGFLYQAAGWKTARPVVAKAEHHPRGVVPASGVHCDESDAAESGGGAVLQ